MVWRKTYVAALASHLKRAKGTKHEALSLSYLMTLWMISAVNWRKTNALMA